MEIVPLLCDYMKAQSARQWHGGKRAEERKEEGRQCRPIHRRGERVMVSCCWPTLSDNWFLVCGSAWQDARRQEPSSAGHIPAVSRERRQPGRRVLLDWFYMGPSLGLVHLYPSLELAMAAPTLGLSLWAYTCSEGMGLGLQISCFCYLFICLLYWSEKRPSWFPRDQSDAFKLDLSDQQSKTQRCSV